MPLSRDPDAVLRGRVGLERGRVRRAARGRVYELINISGGPLPGFALTSSDNERWEIGALAAGAKTTIVSRWGLKGLRADFADGRAVSNR